MKQGTKIVIILLYVDDLLIIDINISLIEEAKNIMHKKFKVKSLGTSKYFLGIKVLIYRKGILLNQRKYIFELISEMGISEVRSFTTPIELKQKWTSYEYDVALGITDNPLLQDVGAY